METNEQRTRLLLLAETAGKVATGAVRLMQESKIPAARKIRARDAAYYARLAAGYAIELQNSYPFHP